MNDFSITATLDLLASIREYQTRHKGRVPERVFVSEEMYAELAKEYENLTGCRNGKAKNKFCDIPFVRYGNAGKPEYYLSDKEES